LLECNQNSADLGQNVEFTARGKRFDTTGFTLFVVY